MFSDLNTLSVLSLYVWIVVSVADPGSGAFLTTGPGSGIRNRFFSGSRIPTAYFLELSDKFLGKKLHNSLTKKFFVIPLFCYCFWIRDPEWVKIKIRDKHPGPATLVVVFLLLPRTCWLSSTRRGAGTARS
jgi:hypothetical protein